MAINFNDIPNVWSAFKTFLANRVVDKTGDTIIGDLTIATNKSLTLGKSPTTGMEATPKEYVDTYVIKSVTLNRYESYTIPNYNVNTKVFATVPEAYNSTGCHYAGTSFVKIFEEEREFGYHYSGDRAVSIKLTAQGVLSLEKASSTDLDIPVEFIIFKIQ